MGTATKTKTTRLMRVTNVASGLKADPPASNAILIKGKVMTPTQVIGVLNPIIGSLQNVATTKAAYSQAVSAANTAWEAALPTISALRPALIQAYGSDSQGLAGCGITEKPRAKMSSADNTVAAQKRAATRKANGTDAKPPKPTITITDVNGAVIGAEPTAPAASAAPAAAVVAAAVPGK